MEPLVERFIKYVRYNTTSDRNSGTHPSTKSQQAFAGVLAEELSALGLSDVKVDEHSYVTATLEANTDQQAPVIGFIAHMDTSPDMTAENVNPRIVKAYDGGDILLNSEAGIVLSPSEFPDLLECKGEDLVVTDGTTLLGADDKAGIAEIITAVEFLLRNPSIRHGKLRICFTPDEEIGEGADFFDVAAFGADFAYTMDGGGTGTMAYENFNAAQAVIEVKGRNIHPGAAKNKMIHAALLAMEFNSMLPVTERPEHTEGYEGFYHLTDMSGTVEEAKLKYIVRDHDKEKFAAKKSAIQDIAGYLNRKYGQELIHVRIKDQYYNMLEKITPVMQVVDLAKKAMEETGVKTAVEPVRGGTDGSRLSYMGLPTPNLFTGGYNYHGRYEFASIDAMKKAVEVIVKIAALAAVSAK